MGESEAGLLGRGLGRPRAPREPPLTACRLRAPLRAGLFALDLSAPHCSARCCYLRFAGDGVWEGSEGTGTQVPLPVSRPPTPSGALQHLDEQRLDGSFRGSGCSAPGVSASQPPAPGMQAGPAVPGKLSRFSPGTAVWRRGTGLGVSSRGHGTVSASEPPTGGLLLCLHLPAPLICSRCPVASPRQSGRLEEPGLLCV